LENVIERALILNSTPVLHIHTETTPDEFPPTALREAPDAQGRCAGGRAVDLGSW